MKKQNFYLGIDGGGTHCRSRLVDEDGNILGESTSGAANTTSGVDVAFASILDATGKIFKESDLDPDILLQTHAGLGLAGLVDKKEIEGIKEITHPFASLVADSDGVAACYGAHRGGDGGIVIFGTGSNGLAFHKGKTINVGGWGFMLSDQGSGAQLGLKALRYAIQASDGIVPSTPLTNEIMTHFNDDPAEAVRWGFTAKPKHYGQFAIITADFAESGDTTAINLITESARNGEALINTLTRRGVDKIVLLGGLSPILINYFSDETKSVFCKPQGDALDGAILMAKLAQTESLA